MVLSIEDFNNKKNHFKEFLTSTVDRVQFCGYRKLSTFMFW